MTPGSRANEIHDLILRLGSRSKSRVDGAKARLAIIGSRAVEGLIAALEGDDTTTRARVMPLLALIQDSRAREPLLAMLLDRNRRLRTIAARSLARFPDAEAAAALSRLLSRDPSGEVRVAAVQSLVEQYAAGEESALCAALERLLDPAETLKVRISALSLLQTLQPDHRAGVVRRLEQDASVELRRALAEQLETIARAETGRTDQVGARLSELADSDYAVWNAAVQALASSGPSVVEAILSEMRRRSYDPEYCTRAGMALRAVGPRASTAIAEAFETMEEPLPLQVLIDVAGALGRKPLIYRLKDLIVRLAGRPQDATTANGFDAYQRVRARAHLELARIGSRVAIDDLRAALVDGERRIELEMLGALSLTGKREEIGLLLAAHSREDKFLRERIGDVVRAIMKRERIRRNDRALQTLAPALRKTLESLLPTPQRATRRRRPQAKP